jgi:DNA-binding XRE family transcriptional regulator
MANPDSKKNLPNYIRIHRRRAGLTQRDLSDLIGFRTESIARHEQFHSIPPLQIALGYEIIFHVPISDLFAGLRDEIATDIEPKLAKLEEQLGTRSARGRNSNDIARKLMWLSDRSRIRRESVHES